MNALYSLKRSLLRPIFVSIVVLVGLSTNNVYSVEDFTLTANAKKLKESDAIEVITGYKDKYFSKKAWDKKDEDGKYLSLKALSDLDGLVTSRAGIFETSVKYADEAMGDDVGPLRKFSSELRDLLTEVAKALNDNVWSDALSKKDWSEIVEMEDTDQQKQRLFAVLYYLQTVRCLYGLNGDIKDQDVLKANLDAQGQVSGYYEKLLEDLPDIDADHNSIMRTPAYKKLITMFVMPKQKGLLSRMGESARNLKEKASKKKEELTEKGKKLKKQLSKKGSELTEEAGEKYEYAKKSVKKTAAKAKKKLEEAGEEAEYQAKKFKEKMRKGSEESEEEACAPRVGGGARLSRHEKKSLRELRKQEGLA